MRQVGATRGRPGHRQRRLRRAAPGLSVTSADRIGGGDRLQGAICQAAAFTDPGRKRAQNQDSFLIAALTSGDGVVLRAEVGAADGRAAAELELDDAAALLVVADGMCGAAAGRLASGL